MQAFHTLYHTDESVLLGAPTGSGKTISAELCMLRCFSAHPGQKARCSRMRKPALWLGGTAVMLDRRAVLPACQPAPGSSPAAWALHCHLDSPALSPRGSICVPAPLWSPLCESGTRLWLELLPLERSL